MANQIFLHSIASFGLRLGEKMRIQFHLRYLAIKQRKNKWNEKKKNWRPNTAIFHARHYTRVVHRTLCGNFYRHSSILVLFHSMASSIVYGTQHCASRVPYFITYYREYITTSLMLVEHSRLWLNWDAIFGVQCEQNQTSMLSNVDGIMFTQYVVHSSIRSKRD